MTVNTVIAGASTCTAPYAPTQQSFHTTAFPTVPDVASGSTTSRSDSERWGDFINVKDYGATGNGVTDDTAAIQRAIDARGAPVNNPAISNPGSRIYFPTGTYKVSLQGTNAGYGYALIWDNLVTGTNGTVFFGDGPGSVITGTVAGYIFLNPAGGLGGGPGGFADLAVWNNSTANLSGAIQLGDQNTAFVERCSLSGFQVLDLSVNNTAGGTEGPHVFGCAFSSSATATSGGSPGSWGIAGTNAMSVIGCNFTGFGGIGAVLTTNVATLIAGCRFEVNLVGINCGILGNAGNNGGPAVQISGISCEDNGTSIKVSAAGQMLISSISIQGENATLASSYGIDLRGSSGGIVVAGATIAGYFTGAGLILNDNDCTTSIIGVLVNVTGGGGSNFSGGYGSTFIGSQNSLNAKVFASKPANPVLGTQVYISDSNTATFGATIAGSGASHVIGQWDGTNWKVAGLYT